MTGAEDRLKESQVVYAVGRLPEGLGLYFAIPDGAWKRMRNLRSAEFNLKNVGIPLGVAMTRVRTRAEGLEMMRKRGLQGDTNPKATEEWILLACGKVRDSSFVLIMISDAARDSMVKRGMRHTFNFRIDGVRITIEMLSCRTHEDGLKVVSDLIGDQPYTDVTDVDVSFDEDPGIRH